MNGYTPFICLKIFGKCFLKADQSTLKYHLITRYTVFLGLSLVGFLICLEDLLEYWNSLLYLAFSIMATCFSSWLEWDF